MYIYNIYLDIYIYTHTYIYIYTFSFCLLQHCNICYFVSQCMFSHALHMFFMAKFLTCLIDLSLLFDLK